ncbi:hypothetical protein CEE37_00465 [candidate division LCP-89 bacterium B3_LCP]|uniref:RNA polymerase subunit sigma-24 n=1 Tax=candidate division LCP-89 bacterium B3_LCP TaxID=2012998 RepID=A0A532V4Q8_UNCL8|nr:MAG: hypothetical protein CEE37_00465 [candidate division LCP-89 bacterium B3_LCP]
MNEEEHQLIINARNGDDNAFSQLVAMHDSRIMSLVWSVLGRGFDADEVYQEIFLKVHRSLGSFRFESQFSTWLHRIAVNVAISHKRSLSRRQKREQLMDNSDDFFASAPANPEDNPENLQLRREVLEQIDRALDELPLRQRTVFVMKHDQGMKLKEIASVLKISEGAVKAYLFRALAKLRVILEPYYRTESQTTDIIS